MDPWPCLFNRSPDLDPAKTDPDPDFAGSGSGKTGSRSGYCRIWVRQNRIQIRIRPDLDPAKPDPDPEFAGFRSGKSGSGSGCCRILIWVFDVDLVFTCSITSGRLSSNNFFGETRYQLPSPGPWGIPGLIPESKFIMDPNPNPGKLFQNRDWDQNRDISISYDTFHKFLGLLFIVLVTFGSFQLLSSLLVSFGHFWLFSP